MMEMRDGQTRLKYGEPFTLPCNDLVLNYPLFSRSIALNLQAHPVALYVSIALVSVYAIRTVKSYAKGKLPPGPKGIPFLGSIFQLSKTPWKEFEVWKKQYGMSTSPP